jgi:hypothetical protein
MEAKPLQTAANLRTLFLCVLIMFVPFPRPRSSTGRLVRAGDPAFVFFHGRAATPFSRVRPGDPQWPVNNVNAIKET